MAWSTCQIIRFPVFFRCGDLLFYLPDQLRQLHFALGLGLCVHIPGHALAVDDGGVAALPQVVIDPADATSARFAPLPLAGLEGAGGRFPGC